MSISTIFQISSQAMTAQRERLETASANLANANTTRSGDGGAYRRRDVIFEAMPIAETNPTSDSATNGLQGVRATTLVATADNGEKRFLPNHPDADANGFVTMPDVNPLEEMVNIMSAARAFEANATAFSTAKEIMRASLKLSEG
ncbi:MAG: flagellar basal body rod protein FlgC [Acidobacteriota bacterium]